MSWERGMVLGAADEVRRIRNDANANMREAQAIIDRKAAENAALEAQIRKLKVALVVEQANSAGISAKLKAYRGIIDRISPNEGLVQATGLRFDNGIAEVFSDRLYNEAFDKVLADRGINGEFRGKAR